MQQHGHGNYDNDRDLYHSSRSHCNDHRNSNVNKLRLDSDRNGLPNDYHDDHHHIYNFASFIMDDLPRPELHHNKPQKPRGPKTHQSRPALGINPKGAGLA